jgi:G:T/U-mismatch repair DNA glycosylase
LLYGARVYVLPSTSGANNKFKSEKLLHFRKLAKLVERVEKARDTQAH